MPSIDLIVLVLTDNFGEANTLQISLSPNPAKCISHNVLTFLQTYPCVVRPKQRTGPDVIGTRLVWVSSQGRLDLLLPTCVMGLDSWLLEGDSLQKQLLASC